MRDERAEPRLALPTVQSSVSEARLDGERDLRGERLERVEQLGRKAVGAQMTRWPRTSSRIESGSDEHGSPSATGVTSHADRGDR